ncbi:hypothetical protein OHJ16_02560 [Actinomyces israelii]|uniref:Uncharacterized protein n=1 Tax=Actinomyces israelii TaxID=1659 RepID=A0ABT4I5Z2_9ACTO|nr:hypothetical protein [Actinomyces israelii]MCZ0856936.1 hypothetical protein [Actinomyces israelii]
MARTVSRSARTERFVKASTARRSQRTTSTETVGRGTSNKTTVNRSAIIGRFVKESTAQRHPDTTITQQV